MLTCYVDVKECQLYFEVSSKIGYNKVNQNTNSKGSRIERKIVLER